MKKLSMLFLCAMLVLFGAGSALAQAPTYQFAEAGTKNFVSEITIDVGAQISLDIYLSNVGEPQQAGGVWIDFSASASNISYVSAGRAVTDGSEGVTGPWLPGIGSLVNEPLGPGTMIIQVANLGGAAPDGDGDLIVANLTLQCTAAGDATIPLDITDLISLWTPISDADVVPGSILIHQGDGGCTSPIDCEDGDLCTDDICTDGVCSNPPVDCSDGDLCTEDVCTDGVCSNPQIDCDDGIGCTDDSCDAGMCVNMPNDANCPDDGLFCNGDEFCDPVNDCSSTGDPCVPPEVCDEVNDVCESDGEQIVVSFDIKPGSCPNAFSVKSNGVLPVAILGTDDFDVTTIDLDSIRLTREGIGNEVPPINKFNLRDAGTPFEGELCDCHKRHGDGYMDLTLKFNTQAVVNGLGLGGIPQWQIMIPLTIVGETYDGTPIKGEDCVMLINLPKNK